ncbi:Oidioi.mRNA.OKI2018_I69.XSR.g15232.t1.cds [Oikopleura dioica]|uniref:Oidioi.mRNA.OKI2018_I69.XSR.g15232.t1.cds n=1 Tax=Oikopleura dioica TaxID=34765 RepID=A0ABN7SJK4_OIKDI|nr:Oidioi.mRNA.OKI2018_I69.XSR.g15232.t1.cds [Oikopleura dioica]
MSSDNYEYGNYDYRKRSKREIKECQCQIYSDTDKTNKGKSKSKKTTKRKLPKKKLKCLVDYSNWKSKDGSSCQEIYQGLERRKDARKIEGYDLCPQSNKCAFEKKYTRGNCSAFLIDYEERGSFAKAREFNGRLDESSWWKGNYTKLPDVVKFGDHSVYKLDKKITYAIYVKQCWVITGHLTDHIPFFKNENANPNCPALSDTNSWEFWDDPAENDPRLRFELPQWKYIHERVPNPKFTTKTLQHSDFSNCNKTVQDAIIFILFSKRFLEDERIWLIMFFIL